MKDTVIHFEGDEEMNTTLDNTAAADAFSTNSEPSTRLTSTDHGFKAGSAVYIQGTTNYDGLHKILTVAANTFDIPAPFVAETPAGTELVLAAFTSGNPYEVIDYELHLDAASGTAENLVVQKDAKRGAAWDHIVETKAMNTVQDYRKTFDPTIRCEGGDVLKFTWANTNNKLWGMKLRVRGISE